MKTKVVPLGLFLMFLCSALTIVATPTAPTIRLPLDLVTMNAVYGEESYFEMTLSDIPLGYDIIDGIYQGWCLQKTIHMTQHVNHTVRLYSCYDSALPPELQTSHWDKINYLLNHKQGNQASIQLAIWFYTNDEDCSADPDASAMVADAEAHGADFVPTNGQIIAIPIEGIPAIQQTFLELTIPTPGGLEGFVWHDINTNGLQDKGEPGMNNIMVQLYQQENLLIKTTTTNSQGYYTYTNVSTGAYYLQVISPSGYHFSSQNSGTDETKDSDVDATGKTSVFLITINQSTQRWDAGMYTTSTSHPLDVPQNHRPTADGTAGEPYNGFVHELITFDGSRSYDRDGRILSWRWNFGDGTNGSGEKTTHSYEQKGNYTVTLTVTDNKFAFDVYTTVAHITIGNNPPATPTIVGPDFGHAKISYEYLLFATDPDNDTLRYVLDWGDGTFDTSSFYPSGYHFFTRHTWIRFGFYTLQIYAYDPNNATSELSEMTVLIDVQYVGNLGYLIDTNGDGIFDLFHTNITSIDTKVKVLENGDYLIDTDGDGNGDIVYNPITHQYQEYHEVPLFEYLLFILLLIIFLAMYLLLRIKRHTRTLSSTRRNNK
jgi:chitodextrinase